MSTAADPNRDLRPYYDAIWNDWLKGRDLESEIEQHRTPAGGTQEFLYTWWQAAT